MRLNAVEGRVIGSLIEKQLTTPQQYPLTLNALLLACNQSSNRDPVVSFDERTVEEALDSLKSAGVLRFVHPSHGRSATRYRQVLEEVLGLSGEQLALLAVLLVRGPQTSGELRARTGRMARFDTTGAVDAQLEQMSGSAEPLVGKLARRPGHKEERWVQLLVEGAVQPARETGDTSETDGEEPASLPALAGAVARLRSDVQQLRADLDDLRSQLGS